MGTINRVVIVVSISFALVFDLFCFSIHAKDPEFPGGGTENSVRSLTLEECLDITLRKNRRRLVAKSSVEIAEAQYRQAQSAYWPQMSFGMNATRLDENPNFIFPESTSVYTISGLAPVPVQATVAVPETEIKLMDRDSLISSLDVVYPVYMGGKRAAVSKQARIGVDAAKESAKRTDLQLVFDVKRLYYGAVLATNLHKLGRETLDRFLVTLKLTEMLYKSGTGTVKKTDYLRTRVIVSTIRSSLALLTSNEELTKVALANAMGLDWRQRVEPAPGEIPFDPAGVELNKLVANAYQFNPDWSRFKLGLEAAEAKIKEARSGHFPKVVLTGSLNRIDNAYNQGLMTDENKNSWAVGIGLQIPIFSGFRTQNEIREAMARLEKIKQEKLLFGEGLALQVKNSFLQMARAEEQVKTTRDSLSSARENRKLNVRAYQNELVGTKDVIEAQLLEPFINAQYLKARHDHAVTRARLDFIIGKVILKPFQ